MIQKIILSEKEYQYLITELLHDHKNILNKIKVNKITNSVEIYVDEDTAFDIRELSSDEVGLHFDENYEPTEVGWILEHFIDKFYFDKKELI
ncbi:hypothetical protein Barb6_02246 [Bacteroidales bacterium Barb6]|nr:hypothetical protein Barb6_02246 [Bacteroidales bacterium Barb6]